MSLFFGFRITIVYRRVSEAPAAGLKNRIRAARLKAVVSVNRELIMLYWHIGRNILTQQHKEGWGAKVIDRLGNDLRTEFPEIKGFSPRSLTYMRAFAKNYPDQQFVQEALAQIAWYHNIAILDKVTDLDEQVWCAHETIQNGWSRNVLVHQIELGLYQRQGKAITNFTHTLPPTQSDLAQQVIKDPYIFDFLSLREKYNEFLSFCCR